MVLETGKSTLVDKKPQTVQFRDMSKAQVTRDSLLLHGKRLFWSLGYSNVSVRTVAMAAGVDVALISRYFGSKRDLFEATLAGIDQIDPSDYPNAEALVDVVVGIFVAAPRSVMDPSAVSMILMNAKDEEVGERVREVYRDKWQAALETIIGGPERAALFTAVMLGFSVAEKSLHLDGIRAPHSADYERQLRHLLNAALAYEAGEQG